MRQLTDQVDARPVDLGAYRLLHVQVSDLYHAGEITLGQATHLRGVINTAFETRRQRVLLGGEPLGEENAMSCSNPDCRKGGCSTEPRPAGGRGK